MNKVADFFDTLADRWDELCYHDPEKLNDILQRTGLRKGLRILDIGCGTGVLESYLLPYSPLQIVGVDISPGMIKKARRWHCGGVYLIEEELHCSHSKSSAESC